MYTCQRLVGLVAMLDSMASLVAAEQNDMPIQIAGTWADTWGTQITVSSKMWLTTSYGASGAPSSIRITHYDNVEGFLVGQNGDANEWNPSVWSRIDWLYDASGAVWYCTSHYAADTEAMAMGENADHDHSLYDTTGCGGFSFSALRAAPEHPLAIAGSWDDAWGTEITVGQDVFVSSTSNGPSIVHITFYDNEQGFLVGQNKGAGSWNPGLWTRIDWVKDTEDNYWYCTTHYDQQSEMEAMGEHADHDHSLYATTGCGGFSFSQMFPPGSSSQTEIAISIAGSWEDDWATKITIGPHKYVSVYPESDPSIVTITQINEDEGYFVGQNGGPGSYNPGLWSRIDWVTDAAGGLHLCSSHFDAPDEASALIPAATTDHSLYDTTGCNGFAFSTLAAPPPAPLAIMGEWEDEYGTQIVASKYAFASTYAGGDTISIITVTHYDNAAGFLVGQNGGDGTYNPGEWTRIDWHKDVEDSYWYCTTHYNAADEAAAMAEHPDHDHSLYDTTGCGGFAFSKLSRPVYVCEDICSSQRRSRHLLFGSYPPPSGCVCD